MRLHAELRRKQSEIQDENCIVTDIIELPESEYASLYQNLLKAIVDNSDNRQNRMMFKLAVEIAIVQNLIAATQDIDPVSLERLRGECVKEVKRLNGGFSFEDALTWQKG